ncbi:peptidoglycan D,D-transpeptidase FtsI family protein [Clostridium intestinale]|uniref:Cell division protein FtsI/penicillin-binding protein 2 n=1 Tax=Clostridium intestinale DSM 6191 TaxID=1121320 RepID=A0A1M5YJK5_9CLOT|nr:penicillin-binding protein 2 [Clostridium intestinale]SHI12217.1 Cell division protein FtsI/penicillin-binding protein 2 [Clostridium intestinale DSM 6191]
MKDIQSSIKKVMIVFSFLLLALITYIAYFQAFKAPDIAEKTGNQRLWAERNKVLRGTIYDRNMVALTESKRKDALTQERKYTQGSLYSHILGYANEKYGLTGLENTYDKELRNYNKISYSVNSLLDTLKIKEAFKNRIDEDEDIVGNSLVTSLDTNVQKSAYQALENKKGAVVVLNPKTGEIIASVSSPTYDPNNLDDVMKAANSGAQSNFPLINRSTAGMYAPGSTFKIVTLTSSLENLPGVTNRTFNDNGKIVFNSKQSLSNYAGASYGSIGLKDALRVSSNVVFGTLAMDLGNSKLKTTAENYYFNKNIPANGVVIETSQFPTIDDSEKGSIAQTGIGQSSILATPMQMALIASAVANDGVMVEPKLVNTVVDKNGKTVKNIDTKNIGRSLSSENAAIIKDYMRNVVSSRENSQWTYFKGLNVAGKTGTADYKLPDGKDAVPNAWFIGFAPADNPQYAIAVLIENGGVGGVAAAETAGKVLKTAMGK